MMRIDEILGTNTDEAVASLHEMFNENATAYEFYFDFRKAEPVVTLSELRLRTPNSFGAESRKLTVRADGRSNPPVSGITKMNTLPPTVRQKTLAQ